MRQLRKVLAESRYQIVNYRNIGYELIVADASDALAGPKPEMLADQLHKRDRL